jgi:acyl-CoA synthetase (AMP-forming)/AMP-acid ligase II
VPATRTVNPSRDVVALPYSSGTTGLPKGVMLSHRNLVANLAQIDFVDSTEVGDCLVGVLPFYHIYGMLVVLCGVLRKGGCVVTMPHFDLEQYLRLTAIYRTKRAYLVPPIALALARHPMVDQFDLSALKFVTSGAAPMGAELEASCAARIGCMVKQGYGMTEASPVTHISLLGRDKEGTVGPPVADTRQKVVSMETGEMLPPGEIGELLVSGPQVMQGYYGRPDATEESIVVDEDGRWLRTGDIVSMDEDGYVTIHDRAKEMIKYKGYQIAPAELESLIMEHPDVADVAVIPKDSGTADGEFPKAFVVRRAGTDVGADAIQTFVAERVAPYKKVREVEFIDAIPKNPSGKILRRELKAKERAAAG